MYPFTYVRGFFTDFLKLFVRMYYWAPPPPRRRTRCAGAATPRRPTRTPRRAPPSAPRPRPAAAEPHGARGEGEGAAGAHNHPPSPPATPFRARAHDRAAAGRHAPALFGRTTLITNNNNGRGVVTLCASHAFQSRFRVSGFGGGLGLVHTALAAAPAQPFL